MNSVRNQDRTLAFMYELHMEVDNFPLHVLQLLNKHFGYDSSSFFPRYTFGQEFPVSRAYTQEPFVDLVSIGVPRERLRRYFAGPHKSSIFWSENMPPALFAKPVVMVDDIMPFEEYRKTTSYDEFSRGGLGDQMRIQLNMDGMQLGCIVLQRRQDEARFGFEDRLLAETLCPHITQAYKAEVDRAKDRATIEFAHQYHASLAYGSIILDNTFTVVCHNQKAQAFCSDVLAHFYKMNDLKDQAHVVLRGDGTVADVQAFVAKNRERLWAILDKPASMQSIGQEQRYASTILSLSTQDATGKMNIHYGISMTAQPAEVVDTAACLRYGLTNREIQVASYIIQGLTNKQIGEEMFISAHTAKTHITKIFAKTGTGKRTELIHKLGNLTREA